MCTYIHYTCMSMSCMYVWMNVECSMYLVCIMYHTYYIRGCIFTPPELVGLWLGSVGIQQAIYSAYEFVTCYDRCMYMYKLSVKPRLG